MKLISIYFAFTIPWFVRITALALYREDFSRSQFSDHIETNDQYRQDTFHNLQRRSPTTRAEAKTVKDSKAPRTSPRKNKGTPARRFDSSDNSREPSPQRPRTGGLIGPSSSRAAVPSGQQTAARQQGRAGGQKRKTKSRPVQLQEQQKQRLFPAGSSRDAFEGTPIQWEREGSIDRVASQKLRSLNEVSNAPASALLRVDSPSGQTLPIAKPGAYAAQPGGRRNRSWSPSALPSPPARGSGLRRLSPPENSRSKTLSLSQGAHSPTFPSGGRTSTPSSPLSGTQRSRLHRARVRGHVRDFLAASFPQPVQAPPGREGPRLEESLEDWWERRYGTEVPPHAQSLAPVMPPIPRARSSQQLTLPTIPRTSSRQSHQMPMPPISSASTHQQGTTSPLIPPRQLVSQGGSFGTWYRGQFLTNAQHSAQLEANLLRAQPLPGHDLHRALSQMAESIPETDVSTRPNRPASTAGGSSPGRGSLGDGGQAARSRFQNPPLELQDHNLIPWRLPGVPMSMSPPPPADPEFERFMGQSHGYFP